MKSAHHSRDAALLGQQVGVHQVHHGSGGALKHALEHVGAQQAGVQVISSGGLVDHRHVGEAAAKGVGEQIRVSV